MDDRYVSKNEVKPYRNKFKNWIDNIRSNIKTEGISFTYMLVGSAKRNLVIRHHNQGFDCDYQIRITKNKQNKNPYEIKKMFIDNINNVKSVDFKDCEDSTRAITIKKLGDNSDIEFSYDIVIIKEEDGKCEILKNQKKKNNQSDYVFEELPNMSNRVENFRKINGPEMWESLRDRYYDKKTNNTEHKKSFQLLSEAVNEVLDKYNL